MPINLSGSLILTGSLTVTGGITMSGSIASASYALSSSYAANADLLDNRDSSTFANTGSNIFVDGQYLSSSFNPTGFSTTASLYTDGGLRVTRDAYISGTLYLNNVTVFGTQSVAYISSSQLNIGTNLITVNTDTPSIRFGGLAVYDSGSTGLTGSLLWDSETNHWIYSNPSGSTYSGGMIISGPRAASLGTEVGTTSCALMMGQGGDHITSSAIFSYGNATCFYGQSFISSSGAACFAGTVCVSRLQVFNTNSIIVVEGTATNGEGTLTIAGKNSSGTSRSAIFKYDNADIIRVATADAIPMRFETSDVTRLTIASTGVTCFACQVYVGTSRLCWTDTTFKTLQVGNGAFNNTENQTQIVNNIYYDNINYKNLIGGAANRLIMTTAGDLQFEYACAASAGTTLTLAPRLFVCGTDGSTVICSTASLKIPIGTSAQRPSSPQTGMIRMNSTTSQPEWYDCVSSSWVSFASQTGTCTYDIQYLIVGGGGGAGGDRAGGGGAGGYRLACTTIVSGISYYAIVGAGGAANVFGVQGGRSSFNQIASIGGGAGGDGSGTFPGTDGGSGGGGGNSPNGVSNLAGAGTTGQGNAGGTGVYAGPNYGAGGGGGAGAVGANGTSSVSGNGGVGCSNSICGVTRFYAGGGGAGNYGGGGNGDGGNGGGGNGVSSGTACNGTANSGGGAGSSGASAASGGSGGSGIVIIRYCGSQRGTGGTVVSCNGHTIHIFSSSTMYLA